MSSTRNSQSRKSERSDPARDHPTVAKVRAVRARMLRDAGGTLEGLIALAARESAILNIKAARPGKRRAA